MSYGRITFSANMLLMKTNLERVQRQYQEASVPATTGLKINNLSDDSAATSILFSVKARVSDTEQFQKNLSTTNNLLNYTESRLSLGGDVLQRTREAGLRAVDGSLTETELSQLADQINQLKSEFLGHANAKLDNRYIFAGTKFSTQPFNGTPTDYNGNSTSILAQISSTLSMQVNVDSATVFMGDIATAVGTDLATTLKDSNGVGLGMAAGDTITVGGTIGAAFTSTFAISATTTLTDIASQMQTIIRANGAGTETVTVRPDGALRVTAGATAIASLTLTTDSAYNPTIISDAFTFPTPIAIAGTGDSDTLQTGSGEDIFDVFDDLETAVSSGDPTDISTHLDRVQHAIDQFLSARGTIGNRLQQTDAVETSLGEDSVRYIQYLSDLQDVNIDEALSNLVAKETALRLVFASSSKVLAAISNIQLQ